MYFYAPATIGRGGGEGILFYPYPSVRSSHLVCIVCPANSSYSFWARPFIFCRQYLHWRCAYFMDIDFQQFFLERLIDFWQCFFLCKCKLNSTKNILKTWNFGKYKSALNQVDWHDITNTRVQKYMVWLEFYFLFIKFPPKFKRTGSAYIIIFFFYYPFCVWYFFFLGTILLSHPLQSLFCF